MAPIKVNSQESSRMAAATKKELQPRTQKCLPCRRSWLLKARWTVQASFPSKDVYRVIDLGSTQRRKTQTFSRSARATHTSRTRILWNPCRSTTRHTYWLSRRGQSWTISTRRRWGKSPMEERQIVYFNSAIKSRWRPTMTCCNSVNLLISRCACPSH